MATSKESAQPLEDHLRNLILNGTESAPTVVLSHGSTVAQDGVDNTAQDQSHQTVASKSARKRPNQAQRRQMSSQMTINIDPRATTPQSSQLHTTQQGLERRSPYNSHHGPSGHYSHEHRGGFQPRGPPHHRGHSHPPGHHYHYHQPNGQVVNSASLSLQPQYQHSWRQQQYPTQCIGPTRGVNVIQPDAFVPREPRHSHGALYHPEGHRQYIVKPEELAAQSELLEQLCIAVVQAVEIEYSEILEKEDFRKQVESICRAAISDHEIKSNGNLTFQPQQMQLKCFGSLASGFATKAADMDLGLISPASTPPPDSPDSLIPRLIERALLDAGFGARLLTRTRVPIIKLCEKPTPQLRADLLEERVKWERGLTEEDPSVADEDNVHGSDSIGKSVSDTAATPTMQAKTPANHAKEHDADVTVTLQGSSPSSLRSSIKQSRDQNLMSYHNQAKKILRQLGGRDVTYSNLGVFTDADFLLLDDVSEAFVEGLWDKTLRDRVKQRPSFSIGKGKPIPNRRTLHGVYNMVEGEKLVMLWESRSASEGDPRLEQANAKTINWWSELHNTRLFGIDPLNFNREMFLSLEKLRKIPSVQLMQLQQDQYESAADYYDRTMKIMAQLNADSLVTTEPGILPPVMRYYVSGIHDKQVRQQVEKFVQSTNTRNIRAVARRHRSLHLAAEYERAIDKGGLYQQDDIPVITEYIEFLRSDMVATGSAQAIDYHLPVSGPLILIYDRILRLPNPARSAQNQPKDRYQDKLEFPQSGVGVQCDINFSAHLALHNSHLLRCYAATDPRVRPMVLFVKHWAKARDINTPYRGTLSSYGYVLMVIHYLVNIAQPFVCPNLQLLAPPDPDLPPEVLEDITTCKGRNVRFWRNEQEIQAMSHEGRLNANRESIGYLLRGFFEYYAQNNMMSTNHKRGFDWGRDVISIRTPGGLLSKQEKNWVQARTTMQLQTGAPPTPTGLVTQASLPPEKSSIHQTSGVPVSKVELPMSPDEIPKQEPGSKGQELKEVRHRFLFAVEDPFEHEHNVARTVTHHGIVSIRDEFRRAWRIIKLAGKNAVQEDLLENIKTHAETLERKQFSDLLAEIHGDMNVSNKGI